ncbi:MAG: GNAT family N-acetyltransferase, partial [Actinomycetota bacterium]
MAVAIRLVRSDEDYAAWRQVRLAVMPNERADSVGDLRAQAGPQHQFLLAEVDGVLAGSGVVGKSDLAGVGQGAIAARVLPEWRRRGVGTASCACWRSGRPGWGSVR